MLLTDAQGEEFARAGYLFFPGLFAPAEATRLLGEATQALAHDGPEVVRERDGESVRTVFAAHRRSDLLGRLVRHPRLIRPAERLLGGPLYLHQFKINVKAAFDGDLWQWHQDFGTWHREDGLPEARAMNLLVFLEEVGEFNGPLMLIPGSHVHGNFSAAYDEKTTSYPLWALDRPTITRLVEQGGIVAPKGPAGSALLFHSNLVHASTCNLSPWRRTSVILSVSRVDNQICRFKRPEWIAHRDFTAIEPLADDCLLPESLTREVSVIENVVSPWIAAVESHPLYRHPFFERWHAARPGPEELGALFHQIQCFCASTRPGHAFPQTLRALGYPDQAALMDEIVASESGHGPELATMAGHIINRASGQTLFPDLHDTAGIEDGLRRASDRVLGHLDGYEPVAGLTAQARRAIAVFDSRRGTTAADSMRSLGAALALEIISHRHLIPGEKAVLVDSGLYGVSLEEAEMHYLAEHWGELGAEQKHESNVVQAITSIAGTAEDPDVRGGLMEFLDALASLWDVLDEQVLARAADRRAEVGHG